MRSSLKHNAISIIMLTYNREGIVGRAIESILDQTFSNFEFIIVDNGSTDRSGVICDSYAAKDLRIKVIHRKRGNIGSGRNTGLDAATGDYIAFIDDDDYAEPDFLEFLYNLIVENDADVSICGATNKIFGEKRIMNAEEALIELMWRKHYNMAFPTKMFKRNIVQSLRFPTDGKYDDINLMYKILAKSKRIAYHGLPKYTFVRHNGNNSAWTTNYSLLTSETLNEYLRSYHERTEWLGKLFPNSTAAFRYFEWSFMISMVDKVIQYKLSNCTEQLNFMLSKLQIHSDEFLNCGFILDFEKEWMEKYVCTNSEKRFQKYVNNVIAPSSQKVLSD